VTDSELVVGPGPTIAPAVAGQIAADELGSRRSAFHPVRTTIRPGTSRRVASRTMIRASDGVTSPASTPVAQQRPGRISVRTDQD